MKVGWNMNINFYTGVASASRGHVPLEFHFTDQTATAVILTPSSFWYISRTGIRLQRRNDALLICQQLW